MMFGDGATQTIGGKSVGGTLNRKITSESAAEKLPKRLPVKDLVFLLMDSNIHLPL